MLGVALVADVTLCAEGHLPSINGAYQGLCVCEKISFIQLPTPHTWGSDSVSVLLV